MSAFLTVYHANAKGTGHALRLEAKPAEIVKNSVTGEEKQIGGTVRFQIAPQMTVRLPSFDWDNTVAMTLDWLEVSQVLQVLRGETEDVNEGKGIFKRGGGRTGVFKFQHRLDPASGYSVEIVNRWDKGEHEDKIGSIFLLPHESLGICEALAGVMYRLTFGEV